MYRRKDSGPLIGNPQYNKQDDEEGMQADCGASVTPMVEKEVFFGGHGMLPVA